MLMSLARKRSINMKERKKKMIIARKQPTWPIKRLLISPMT